MIEMENVSKRFASVTAVDGVSLRIGLGERVGFVGANGSGKTTLLRAVCGLLRVSGRVLVDGCDVAKTPERALAQVSYMPQIAPPLETPVGELVRAQAALRRIEPRLVYDYAQHLGLELNAIAGARLRDLSGGTKQKVLAALALAAPATVLICDEPTANLDASARAAFFRAVDARPPESVLILCSHRVEEIRHLVDRVVELSDGRVVADVQLADSPLRMCRVDVTVSPSAPEAEAWLLAAGCRSEGRRRFSAQLPHAERLELVAQLLARHRRAVVDLCLDDVETLDLEVPALKAVS